MKTAGVFIDAWKLTIFERTLRESGYTWTQHPGLAPKTLLLKVATDNMQALAQVILRANQEAARTGPA